MKRTKRTKNVSIGPKQISLPQEAFKLLVLILQMQGKSTREITTRRGRVKRREALKSTEKAKAPLVTEGNGAQMTPAKALHHKTSAKVKEKLPFYFHNSECNNILVLV